MNEYTQVSSRCFLKSFVFICDMKEHMGIQ